MKKVNLNYAIEDGKVVTTFGNFKWIDDQAESIEEIRDNWLECNDPEVGLVQNPSIYKVLGLIFHCIQQLGGKLLCKGIELHATTMDQTSGEELSDSSLVNYDGRMIDLGYVIRNFGGDFK